MKTSSQLLIFFLLLFSMDSSYAKGNFGEKENNDKPAKDTFPVPVAPNMLFYVQRTPNINTIVYEADVNREGKLNADEPIHVYWIRYTDGGIMKDLNYVQKHFAYGVKTEKLSDGRYKVNFVAYKQRNLYLAYAPADKKYHIYCNVNNKTVILSKIYIQIDPGGSFWSPNVRYLELKGREVATGKELVERIMID